MSAAATRYLASAALVLALAAPGAANADVWMWTDAHGEARFVDTARPIFTWVDAGRVHFSDTPDHAGAVAVQLVWHSAGTLADLGAEPETDEEQLRAEETPAERAARIDAQQKYCKRITEIHDSYTNAPRMYRTNDKGEREYLKKYEVRRAIREIAAVKKDACKRVD